jgi:tetratricopeptide (TPR) repeat protein
MKKKFILLLILLTHTLLFLSSQDDSLNNDEKNPVIEEALWEREMYPAWLLLERGKNYRMSGRIAEAFLFLLSALEKDPSSAEIEYELGRAYIQSGDLNQARRHLYIALEKPSSGEDTVLQQSVHYLLARLFVIEEDYLNFEKELQKIISVDEEFSGQDDSMVNLRVAMRKTLMQSGLNRLLVLYRIDDSVSQDAHRQLGIFYHESGRYNEAINHLLFSIIKPITRVISIVRQDDFDFVFSSIPDLFEKIDSQDQLRKYLVDAKIYESMFYLSASIIKFNPTALNISQNILNDLSKIPDAGRYRTLTFQ